MHLVFLSQSQYLKVLIDSGLSQGLVLINVVLTATLGSTLL